MPSNQLCFKKSKYDIKVGIIGGSGLDDPDILQNAIAKEVNTPFGKPSSALVEGTIGGVPCVVLSRHGKKHNIIPSNVNFRANIWALKDAGCTHVIVSSACGSLQKEIAPGDLVIPDSFIDMTKKRVSTFYNNDGPYANTVLHIPMEPAFCNRTRSLIVDAAKELNIKCKNGGTTVVVEGPRFSSIAESKLFQSWGADLTNMTMVPEVILAKEAGLCYACIAMATDYDCWNASEEMVNVENVVKTFKQNVEKVKNVMLLAVKKIAAEEWNETINNLQDVVKGSIQSKE
ncbi:S-methyl-5'-thioadenosine phosphorylase-like [Planococcus citri]|uniref:S-methyl-5'-thioadenosine phosphorylase-like n=1 Tax=Planococcus citri TaxID=170843 RepID=UPI0031F9AEB6